MDAVVVLRALGGTAREGQLRATVGRRRLKRAVAAGAVIRVSYGTYKLPPAERGRVLATGLRGVQSHRSAARHWGFALPPTAETEDVTIPKKAQRSGRPAGVALHYRDIEKCDVIDGVTSPTQTVLDCLGDLDLPTALAVGDSALRGGRVTLEDLRSGAAGLGGPRGGRVRARIGLLDARSANAFESTCRALLLAAGITGFVPQRTIRSRGRWLGRVDLAHDRLLVLIECEASSTTVGATACDGTAAATPPSSARAGQRCDSAGRT